jgi:hypothetical protein
MAKDNTTKYILLGLLSHEPMSGYDMKKRIDTTISKFWSVGYGQIYPTLNDLEEEGLIKKVFSETSKGPHAERVCHHLPRGGSIGEMAAATGRKGIYKIRNNAQAVFRR